MTSPAAASSVPPEPPDNTPGGPQDDRVAARAHTGPDTKPALSPTNPVSLGSGDLAPAETQPECACVGSADAARGRLLEELATVHAQREDLVAAGDEKTWREGSIALQLVAEFQLTAREIAAEMNARVARPRMTMRERWVQRLVQVQRAFPTEISRVAAATWKNHANALDVARLQLGLDGKHAGSITDDSLAKLTLAARALVVDALRHEERCGADPDRRLYSQRAQAEDTAAVRVSGAPTEGGVRGRDADEDEQEAAEGGEETSVFESDGIDAGFEPEDPDAWQDQEAVEEDPPPSRASRQAFEEALASLRAFVATRPPRTEINSLLSILRDARRSVQ